MSRPKDIATGDWGTAFALLPVLPCRVWRDYLLRHDTLRSALLSVQGTGGMVNAATARVWLRDLGAPVASGSVSCCGCSHDRFTSAEVDGIVAHLRARFLEQP